MVCAPVRRDNPRALARGLSTVQAHKPCSISYLERTRNCKPFNYYLPISRTLDSFIETASRISVIGSS